MVRIRLSRQGSKNNPYYHIIIADARAARDGKRIEKIGTFNPVARGQACRLELNEERLTYWQEKGAQASLRVKKLIKETRLSATKPRAALVSNKERRKQQSEDSIKANKAKKVSEKNEAEATAEAADS